MTTSSSFAQQYQECGTIRSAEDEATINEFVQQYRSGQLDVQRDYGDSMVPVKFHIIANDLGFSGIDSASVFEELDSINTHYKAAGIVFYHCDNIDYIFSSNDTKFFNIKIMFWIITCNQCPVIILSPRKPISCLFCCKNGIKFHKQFTYTIRAQLLINLSNFVNIIDFYWNWLWDF